MYLIRNVNQSINLTPLGPTKDPNKILICHCDVSLKLEQEVAGLWLAYVHVWQESTCLQIYQIEARLCCRYLPPLHMGIGPHPRLQIHQSQYVITRH